MMNAVLINDIQYRPHIAHELDDLDNSPLPEPEDEFVSLVEFKSYMEQLAFERLGLNITL